MTDKEIEFERLVRKQKSTIYSVCYMFSKDTDEVADLFQEVLIHMWTGFDAFRGASSPKTWIYRIALNTCVSQDRSKKRQGERIPLSMDIDPFEGTDERALQVQGLYKRISRLGLVDRSIILLWLEALSYDEIGQIVGISPKNVSVRLFRLAAPTNEFVGFYSIVPNGAIGEYRDSPSRSMFSAALPSRS